MKEILTEWRKFINEQEQLEIPPVLYHATYEPLLKSVQGEGLGGLRDTQYEDSVRGVVYLALDPDVAFSYAETSDAAWDKFETDEGLPIVTLEIDTSQLDKKLFKIDSNVQGNQGETLEYHGVVPPQAISVTGRTMA
jgi:hypothetical protein